MGFPSAVSGAVDASLLANANKVLGDHVDILGRSSLNDLVLRVAGGRGDWIEENYVSKIREYSEKVKVFEEDSPPNG